VLAAHYVVVDFSLIAPLVGLFELRLPH
jgi:hypothetical protein